MCLKTVLGCWSLLFHILPAAMFCLITGSHTASPSDHGPKPLKSWSKTTLPFSCQVCVLGFFVRTIESWPYAYEILRGLEPQRSQTNTVTGLNLLPCGEIHFCAYCWRVLGRSLKHFGHQFPLVKHADIKRIESNNACRVPRVISGT